MKIYELLQNDPDIWDLFTRKEEYNASIRDQYDRFSYYMSGNRNVFQPAASKYLIDHGYYVEYPENKPFAVCLTHDIDDLYKTIGTKTYEALINLRNFFRFSFCLDSLAQMRSKELPWWNFSDIMALEDRYDAKSSFYFMVQNRHDQDYNYDLEDCESIIGEISDRGYEVGLHGGHTAYNSQNQMKEQKQCLEKVLHKKVVGYRNHYLRFKVPETWEYLCDSGFLYDSTFGYNDCVGFRNGMCHPFKPYNLKTGKSIEILEIPLNLMDRSLNLTMKLDTGAAWEISKRLIDTTQKYNGVITLLWHNNDLIGNQRKLYEKILKYCAERNAWMTSGEEIVQWWKQHVKD